MTFKCCLCQKIFSLRKQLLSHERVKHRNNKTIPHRHLLSQPSVEQLISYQDAFIILIKKRLGFNRHSVGSKRLSINVFPEKIFVYLFQNEPLFRYNSALRKYHCKFKGEAGELRLKQILNYEHWNCRQDPKTNTTGYVLFANYEGIYEVTFSWAQTELVENDRIFQCGTVTCKFTTDSGEFVDENGIMSNQEYQSEGRTLTHNKNSLITFNTNNNQSNPSRYKPILPRSPLQQLALNQL
ncbi:hypothetical protein RclHR1_16340005 [Rhizophagus clarus]|uniref:C2H2-type domain-containing protein n=1 Tax=Rhizophagus clarus TaxID=94130 RepID=A0A2Z6QUT9_9GLOM|nr:hypothetical protein RclHR1_16340005 [Rhizophagus clarus]GES96295.1 hypothetical protein GLOIN_2v1524369 [Rhizophagus clarus]